MFLLEGSPAPDHATFARFRSIHFAPCSKRILAEMSNALFDMGEISGETIFIDGTKIEASANKYTFVWKKAVTKNQAKLLQKLADFVAECELLYDIKIVYGNTIKIKHVKKLRKKLYALKETENMGVETTYDVNLCTGEFKYISVYDFIEILGILIDNARDAILSNKTTQNNRENIRDNNECGNEGSVKGNNDCEKKENITIKIAETEKKVIVEVSNPYTYCTEDEIIKMFEKGYSTKGEDRGIGLNKIKEYQDKYKFDILVENIMTKIGNTIKFSVIIEK